MPTGPASGPVITPEIIQQVALLARLKLEGAALTAFASQLDGILAYVRQLQAVPTEGVAPTSHVLPLSNVLRADELRPSLGADEVVKLAPAPHPPYVTVPKVIE
jgi:aspartyl-tRNA(Asn)/glutamyl-tRNA(Gln) amidotransferase subunit C